MRDFSTVAPYLKDPLVLIGFFLFLAFLFTRSLVTKGIIPPLPPGPGFKILKTLLLYGFILGFVLILLGFGLKYREQSRLERQAAADRQERINRDNIESAERERERQRALQDKRQREEQLTSLLRQELHANLATVSDLSRNTQTLLGLCKTVSTLLRTPGIKILPVLFPQENIQSTQTSPSELAGAAIDLLAQREFHKDVLERQRFNAVMNSIGGTIDHTIATVRSLQDADHTRFHVVAVVWDANLPELKETSLINVTDFQRSYTELARLRNNYDVVIARGVDFLEAVRDFAGKGLVNRDTLGKVLAAERLAYDLGTTYGKQLVANIETLKSIEKRVPAPTVTAQTPGAS